MNKKKQRKKNKPDKKTGSIIDEVFAPSRQQQNEAEKEDVSKIINEWLSTKHIDKKTRYTPNQVVAVSILQSLADTYKIKTLQRFLKAFKMAKLSEGGKSSEELENILKDRFHVEDDMGLKKLGKFLE